MCARMYAFVYACMYVSMYECVYVYMYVCIYGWYAGMCPHLRKVHTGML